MADNRIAYGMLKQAGINTDGMSPKEAWEKVNELGLQPSEQTKPTKESVHEKARKIAHNVNITSESYEAVDRALDTALSIIDEYGLDKLESIETVDYQLGDTKLNPAQATARQLLISNSFLLNPLRLYNKLRQLMEECKNDYELERYYFNILPNSDIEGKRESTEKLIKLSEIVKFSRLNVMYEDCIIECVITHEIGHVLYKQKLQFDATKKQIIEDAYKFAINRGYIYSLSHRAFANEREFFSEALSLYKNGKEPVPEYISNLMKEVLK